MKLSLAWYAETLVFSFLIRNKIEVLEERKKCYLSLPGMITTIKKQQCLGGLTMVTKKS